MIYECRKSRHKGKNGAMNQAQTSV